MTSQSAVTYYAATAIPNAPRPRLTQDIDTGVCIVGGGFAGLWTARALARRGYDVVVIEGRTIAGEASGRSGGLVSAGYAERLPRIVERVGLQRAKALYALSRQGIDIVSAALADGIPGVEPTAGRLNVLRYDDEEGLRREADFLGEHFGHEMVVWPTERVREMLKTTRYFQALHDADAFSIHPLNLALALAAEIEKLGGRIFEQTVATGADLEGVWKWISTTHGRVRAHATVFCGSAFIGEGFPMLARAILPVASYSCVTGPVAERLQEAIRYPGAITDTRRAGDYYRVIGDRLMWGGRISTATDTPRRLERRLARDMALVYPSLKGVEIEYAWSGIMGYAIHRMPQIGMLRPGAWVASAFGGHGLNTTAMAGDLVATGIADNDERWRQFIPFGLVWAGGAWGRRTTQLVYWGMQIRDKLEEANARRKERAAGRAKAVVAAKKRAAKKAAEEAAREAARVAKEVAAAKRKRESEELARLLALEEEDEKRRKAEAAGGAMSGAEVVPLSVPAKAAAESESALAPSDQEQLSADKSAKRSGKKSRKKVEGE
jgi:glycine/D-amino acid oxidase-like deaminating enzyme